MTTNEQFKKRVRARMAKTGERYGAARRALKASPKSGERVWVSEPENSEESVRKGTGRGWNEWCDLIDAWPGSAEGHAAVAAWVHAEFGVTHWWSQGITVGWERITGRRVPGQMTDGTFSVSKSKTVSLPVDALRAMLLDDTDRSDLLGMTSTLRSKPTTKVLRVQLDEGVLLFTLTAKPSDRTSVTVTHEKLPDVAAIARWREHWATWLDALVAAAEE